jgi:hypothetical protein
MLFLPLRQRKMKGIFKFWFSKVTRLSKQRPPPLLPSPLYAGKVEKTSFISNLEGK